MKYLVRLICDGPPELLSLLQTVRKKRAMPWVRFVCEDINALRRLMPKELHKTPEINIDTGPSVVA